MSEFENNEPVSADRYRSVQARVVSLTAERDDLQTRAVRAEQITAVVRAERVKLRARVVSLTEAARNAHGILQYNHGDVDPHIRAACDVLWTALAAVGEGTPETCPNEGCVDGHDTLNGGPCRVPGHTDPTPPRNSNDITIHGYPKPAHTDPTGTTSP